MAESWPRSGKKQILWCVYIWLKGYLSLISTVAFSVYCCWMVLWKMGLKIPWRSRTPWSCEWKTSRGIWNEWKPFRPPRCSVYHWRMSICRFFGEGEKPCQRFSKLSGGNSGILTDDICFFTQQPLQEAVLKWSRPRGMVGMRAVMYLWVLMDIDMGYNL